ncbi:MAG: hypothetical protein CMI16_06905 [Opitutaceae bacterium]|nr:hypothetical protein [Opitutaceae bacterium]
MTEWIEDARRLVDDILEAVLTFMSTTKLELKVEPFDPRDPGERVDRRDPYGAWRRVLAKSLPVENVQRYVDDNGLTHATRVVTRTRPSTRLTDTNRRFVMADACVLVTQIVARALTKRGVPGVSVGECLFRVNDSVDVPALFAPKPNPGYRLLHVVRDRTNEGLGTVLAHSVLRVDGLVVDFLAPALGNGRTFAPFVWPDDAKEREHPERTGTYANWRKVASENQNYMLGESLESLFEELMFGELFPVYDHQEKVLLENVSRAIDRFVFVSAAKTT